MYVCSTVCIFVFKNKYVMYEQVYERNLFNAVFIDRTTGRVYLHAFKHRYITFMQYIHTHTVYTYIHQEFKANVWMVVNFVISRHMPIVLLLVLALVMGSAVLYVYMY